MTTTVSSNLLKIIETAEQTITGSSNATIAHGLGYVPKDATLWIRCKTAEGGASVGDEIPIGNAGQISTSQAQLVVNATNLIITTIASGSLGIWNRSVFNTFAITPGNWRYFVRYKG